MHVGGPSAMVRRPPIDHVRVALVYVGGPESATVPVMTPPLGVQLLGTLLRRAGHVVECFDVRLAPEDEVLRAIVGFSPDLVGFSFLSAAAADAVRLSDALRAHGLVTVAGGVHASICGAELLAQDSFDVVVAGEGEDALLDICARAQRGAPIRRFVEGAAAVSLDHGPLDIFDCYRDIYASRERPFRTYAVQLGRGCPMACAFCEMANDAALAMDRAIGLRARTLEPLVDEVTDVVRRFDVNHVIVVDSIATLYEPLGQRFVTALGAFEDVGLQLNAHVNKFGVAFADALRPLGSRASVWFGFESGSDRVLEMLRKGHTVERALEKAKRCIGTGARLGANLLLGIPGETPADEHATDDFVEKLVRAERYDDQVLLNPNILNPLPGTAMHAWCTAAGLLSSPSDHTIWSAERIRAEGRGPVLGVDYARVLERYDRFHAPRPGPEYVPWAEARQRV
jgi:radical SAM superfamily enzyme YgiQ (UPF0313 family)